LQDAATFLAERTPRPLTLPRQGGLEPKALHIGHAQNAFEVVVVDVAGQLYGSMHSILGKSKELERRTGAILSRMIFAAIISPLIAAATTALTIFSASSCMSLSASIVVLCRAPFGFPAGLPDCPF
jgi:hypothetical protein